MIAGRSDAGCAQPAVRADDDQARVGHLLLQLRERFDEVGQTFALFLAPDEHDVPLAIEELRHRRDLRGEECVVDAAGDDPIARGKVASD
jgi:hypothetical protein